MAPAIDEVATLAPTIAKSKLPASLIAGVAAKGTVTLDIANVTGAAIKGKTTLALFASADGVIDGASIELAQRARMLKVDTSAPAVVTLPVKVSGTELPAGTYTLLAQVIDPSNNTADAPTGPTVTVGPGYASLTGAFTKDTLPVTTIAGEKVHATLSVRVTNIGNITLADTAADLSSDVALFRLPASTSPASDAGVEAGAPPYGSSQLPIHAGAIRVKAGQTKTVTLHVTDLPPDGAVAPADWYVAFLGATTPAGDLLAAARPLDVADPSVVLTPTVAADTIPDSVFATAKVRAAVSVRITNDGNVNPQVLTGGSFNPNASTGKTTVQLLATPTAGGEAFQLNAVKKTLHVRPGKSGSLSIPVGKIPSLAAGQYALSVQVTDPNGNVTSASSKTVTVTT